MKPSYEPKLFGVPIEHDSLIGYRANFGTIMVRIGQNGDGSFWWNIGISKIMNGIESLEEAQAEVEVELGLTRDAIPTLDVTHKARFLPKTTGGKLMRLEEEMHEVGEAVSKTFRVCLEENEVLDAALEGGDPTLPEAERETNREWILREIADLEHAIVQVKRALS